MNLFLRDMVKGLMCAYLFENNILFARLHSNIQLRGDESHQPCIILNILTIYDVSNTSMCGYVTRSAIRVSV